jgi:hypothetical protein
MSPDDFESERYRMGRVVEILEHAVRRLEDGGQVPLSLLRDAVTFIRTSEENAYEAARTDDSEPALSACIEHHFAARRPLSAMAESLKDLESGNAAGIARFARAARDYADLRRRHLDLDDALFARGHQQPAVRDEPNSPAVLVETADIRRIYDGLVEVAALLALDVPTAHSRGGSTRSSPAPT